MIYTPPNPFLFLLEKEEEIVCMCVLKKKGGSFRTWLIVPYIQTISSHPPLTRTILTRNWMYRSIHICETNTWNWWIRRLLLASTCPHTHTHTHSIAEISISMAMRLYNMLTAVTSMTCATIVVLLAALWLFAFSTTQFENKSMVLNLIRVRVHLFRLPL